ncbi:MAG: hypothetical protein FD147_2450 [Chloroflexi bacterium]|nr:MAG: hypothetical protein FD147_2450 [Chloroflexota bacterium]
MPAITISQFTARQLALFAQGLLQPLQHPATKTDVKSTVSRLGVLQIDTINIVARSPYFALWSRLGDFDMVWLNQLLEEKQIFEYWAHAASILPKEDYPFHRRLMLDRLRLPGFERWYSKNKAEADAVLEYVKTNGAVRSSDFQRKDGQRGTWWNWKVEKEALEYWFASGELMIARRVNFQRIYDLRERIIPEWKDTDTPDFESVVRILVLKSIASLGIALPGWVADYFRLSKTTTQTTINRMVNEKRLMEVQVEGWSETAWVCPEVWGAFQTEISNNPNPLMTTLLTPFDSLIWDRSRTRQLFGFEYTIECYTPAAKRRFGYFVLPILHDGNLIGRLDAKAHRVNKRFEVKALYFEMGVKPSVELAQSIAGAINRCAAWHKTPEVILGMCEPDNIKQAILRWI